MTLTTNIRVEKLANGFYRVSDSAADWVAIYNEDGTWRHSAVDLPAYRSAVAAHKQEENRQQRLADLGSAQMILATVINEHFYYDHAETPERATVYHAQGYLTRQIVEAQRQTR